MAKKVTMQQIADYLGVSKYVVSKALSRKEGVSEATRERVLDTASKLGYFAQKQSGTGLFSKDDNHMSDKPTLLVLMPNVRFQTKDSSYWGRILKGITSVAETMGIGLVIITETNVTDLSYVFNPKIFLGVISVGLVSTPLLLEINKSSIPLVMVDHEDPLLPCDTIFNNNFDSGSRLANHLIGLGHKNIQFVGDITYSRSFYDRWIGLRSALEASKIFVEFDSGLCTIDSTDLTNQFRNWLGAQSTLPDAFFCANDSISAKVIAVLQEGGKKVPADISVTGYDNKEMSYSMSPTLTTVHVDKEDLGKRAVEMLMRRLREKDAPFEKLLLLGKVMLRESTAVNRTHYKNIIS
jgi:LacI family transcriptional regulator